MRRNGYLDAVPNDAGERGTAFANLIREARRRLGLTQEQVIDGSGVSKTTLIRWEGGKAERPDPDQVRELCRFLGVDPAEAAIALGYLKREDLAPVEVQGRALDPAILEVIDTLEDPNVSEAAKVEWLKYLRFLREQSRRTGGGGRQAG
jgi:transcriptional regulator with XRE-family HTH domain